jgi:nucleoside triphosphate diphosphatase
MTPSRDLARLVEIMAALRTPVTGCPWDLEQTFDTIAPYTIEEAYEVADAIERGDRADLKDELGDLLLQVVYHARLAEEENQFAFQDVVLAVTTKMIRRHPHVFGDEQARAAGAAKGFWNTVKAEEKAEKASERVRLGGAVATSTASLLDDVPRALPALTRAVKLQDKAAKVGFDWPSLKPVFDKMREELLELEDAVASTDRNKIQDEFGDLLFVMANVARHLELDPESALRGANHKFARRFAHIEKVLAASGRGPAQSNLAEMDALWDQAKEIERSS